MPETTVKPKSTVQKPTVQKTVTEKPVAKSEYDFKDKPITLADMAKMNKKIEENNKKAGIKKPQMRRARDARTLPIANK